MRKVLVVAGLILFPLVGLFCFVGSVAVQLTGELSGRPFGEILLHDLTYKAGASLFFIAFIVCVVAVIRSTNKQSRLK
jgi:hypothetical protein